MSPGVKLLTHLFINECELAPGSEWKDSSPGWKIVLVSKGYFYWIGRAEVRDLKTGDVLVIGPAVEGALRASQISPATLHFFYFQPEHLVGMMSLSERLSLEAFAQTAQTRIIPATESVAKEFADLAHNSSRRRSFFLSLPDSASCRHDFWRHAAQCFATANQCRDHVVAL